MCTQSMTVAEDKHPACCWSGNVAGCVGSRSGKDALGDSTVLIAAVFGEFVLCCQRSS